MATFFFYYLAAHHSVFGILTHNTYISSLLWLSHIVTETNLWTNIECVLAIHCCSLIYSAFITDIDISSFIETFKTVNQLLLKVQIVYKDSQPVLFCILWFLCWDWRVVSLFSSDMVFTSGRIYLNKCGKPGS